MSSPYRRNNSKLTTSKTLIEIKSYINTNMLINK